MISTSFKSIIFFLFTAIGIHFLYEIIVIPESQLYIDLAKQEGKSLPRNFLILIKDIEQEICIILMFLGSYLIITKIIGLLSKKYLVRHSAMSHSRNSSCC